MWAARFSADSPKLFLLFEFFFFLFFYFGIHKMSKIYSFSHSSFSSVIVVAEKPEVGEGRSEHVHAQALHNPESSEHGEYAQMRLLTA